MKCSVNADLSTKEIGGELFIYNRKNSTIYSFNGTGVFIWNMLAKGLEPGEISLLLCRDYEVPPEEAEKDVSDFVHNLFQNGLVSAVRE